MLSVASLRTTARLAGKSSALFAARGACAHQVCWGSTLVLSDPLTPDGHTPPPTQSAITAAAKLGGDSIELLVVGDAPPTKIPAGVSKVYFAAAPRAAAETVASTLQATSGAGSYDYVVGTSSKFGATVIPRVAALLGVSPVTDIIEILEPGT